ncbi:hypothetical protein HDU91_005919 [Kappamyces sp. JEL0680]|nr:hypothetical protein HDU91_005919 [Kappamyces sp. JEL0680]
MSNSTVAFGMATWAAKLSLDSTQHQQHLQGLSQAYDFVVCGGGTAACVVAARIAQTLPHARVLLLEAGQWDSSHLLSVVPAGFPKLFHTAADWNYYTEPEKEMKNRRLFWPRGKMVGGCSAINAMVSTEISSAGWGWKSLYPLMVRGETVLPGTLDAAAQAKRGSQGPLISQKIAPHPATLSFLEACKRAGFVENADFNGDDGPMGCGQFVTNVSQRGVRSSTSSFLSVRSRPSNLTVITGCHVCRIVTNNGRATGVECILLADPSKRITVHARKEVILSAGAVGSPQILQLSGIGPRAVLQPLGIPVVQDLPVGDNLQDHLAVPSYAMVPPGSTYNYLLDILPVVGPALSWLATGKGPLVSNGAEAGAFCKAREFLGSSGDSLQDITAGPRSPDVEILFIAATNFNHGRPVDGDYLTMETFILQPASKGTVRITSRNPLAAPAIQPNYLSTQHDRDMAVASLKIQFKIWSEFAGLLIDKFRPGPNKPPEMWESLAKKTDEQLLEWIRERGETNYHPTGTCKMAPRRMGGVVDPHLKVYGVEALRVVDASIMPEITSGHTALPACLIGEKAGDLIAAEWKLAFGTMPSRL